MKHGVKALVLKVGSNFVHLELEAPLEPSLFPAAYIHFRAQGAAPQDPALHVRIFQHGWFSDDCEILPCRAHFYRFPTGSDAQQEQFSLGFSSQRKTYELKLHTCLPHLLDAALAIAYARELVSRGHLLIHSAGVVFRNKGYLFLGKSGAGKSTLCAGSPQVETIHDDLVAVDCSQQQCKLYALPFASRPICTYRGSIPLSGICKLEQAQDNVLVPFPNDKMLPFLLNGLSFHPGQDAALARQSFRAAAKMAASVPCFSLKFTKACDFWHLIH